SPLENWVRLWLQHALGPLDGVVVAAVCRQAREDAGATAWQANQHLWVSLLPPTLRHASRDMGEQLLALAESWPWAVSSVPRLRQIASCASGSNPQSAIRDPKFQQWHHAPVFATLAAAAGSSPREALTV